MLQYAFFSFSSTPQKFGQSFGIWTILKHVHYLAWKILHDNLPSKKFVHKGMIIDLSYLRSGDVDAEEDIGRVFKDCLRAK